MMMLRHDNDSGQNLDYKINFKPDKLARQIRSDEDEIDVCAFSYRAQNRHCRSGCQNLFRCVDKSGG